MPIVQKIQDHQLNTDYIYIPAYNSVIRHLYRAPAQRADRAERELGLEFGKFRGHSDLASLSVPLRSRKKSQNLFLAAKNVAK